MEEPYIDSNGKEIILKKKLKKSKADSQHKFPQQKLSTALSENEILKQIIRERLRLSSAEINAIVEKKKELFLPVSIFSNKLSTLEVVVKFLKEEKKLSFAEISRLLNRDDRTVWHAYRRAVKKKIEIKISDSKIEIPVSIFSERKYSPLESLAAYLRDSHELKFTEIAGLLKLSPKTVGTVYRRYQKKNASK